MSPNNKTKGVILIVLGSLSFAFMNTCVKFLGDLPVIQKVFFRNLFAFFISLGFIKGDKKVAIGNNIPFLLIRSITGYIGIILNFYAISKLNLADASILVNTSPFFIIIFSFWILKEPLKKFQIPILFLAFLGAALVIKPRFNYTVIHSIAALCAGAFAGFSFSIVRYLSEYDKPETIVFYFSGISVIITFPFLIFGHYITPTFVQWILLMGIGGFGALAQILITNAYRYAPASELSIYNYTQIVFVLIMGAILWNELPDLLSFIGGIFIIMAGYIHFHYNRLLNKKESSADCHC